MTSMVRSKKGLRTEPVRSPNIKKKLKSDPNGKSKRRVGASIIAQPTLKYQKPPIHNGIKKTVTEQTKKEIDLTIPRDIYNRPRKLESALNKLQCLDDSDREDILKFVQHMNDDRTADLTVAGKVGRLITLREKLKNTFRDATEDDLRALFNHIETVGWKRNTEIQYRKYSGRQQ